MSSDTVKGEKPKAISGPFAIITGIPKEFGGTLVIASAEYGESYEGEVTVTGKVMLRMPDLDSATDLVKLAQEAVAKVNQ